MSAAVCALIAGFNLFYVSVKTIKASLTLGVRVSVCVCVCLCACDFCCGSCLLSPGHTGVTEGD